MRKTSSISERTRRIIKVNWNKPSVIAGRITEIGPVREVIKHAKHPYTDGLMGSIPVVGQQLARLTQIDGAMPRLNAIPAGCPFNPRCPRVVERCYRERPEPIVVDGGQVACWHYAEEGADA